jgi:hypothetical protein
MVAGPDGVQRLHEWTLPADRVASIDDVIDAANDALRDVRDGDPPAWPGKLEHT